MNKYAIIKKVKQEILERLNLILPYEDLITSYNTYVDNKGVLNGHVNMLAFMLIGFEIEGLNKA